MVSYVIEGGHKLSGELRVNGSKNAALPMLAATLLTAEPCIIHRVPMIRDVEVMIQILRSLGALVEVTDHTVTVQAARVLTTQIPDELASKLRASILLMGPMLARARAVVMKHPGGCVLGKRPVGTHFDALSTLGANFSQDDERYFGKAAQLTGAEMFLDEVSVTATENALMAAVLASGTTVIEPAACEPHIVSLGKMLISMGAQIEGLGTHKIVVLGVQTLNGTEAVVNADEIETGSLAIAIGLTHGEATLTGVDHDNLAALRQKLDQFGIITQLDDDKLHVFANSTFKAARVQIDTWPRLSTDLQPQFTVLATQAEGTSLIHDWMYDRRLMYIDELSAMGANIMLCDPHRALVTGPTSLKSKTIISPDIRAGMAFILAGLIASGKTTIIEHADLVERGYERIWERLTELGAHIERIEN